jgi:integrase
VYAGVDPVTGKDTYLSESTTDERKIPEIRTRLLAQVDRQRNAATKATLAYVLDEWLEVHEADENTIANYRWLVKRTIATPPATGGDALGDVPVSKLGPRDLERFYAQLRRCRVRCNGKPFTEHRVEGPHECRTVKHRWPPGRPSAKTRAEHDCQAAGCKVTECGPHVCKPLSRSTVRQIHSIISGALSAATRWDWTPSNAASDAKRPRPDPPTPTPPTAEQAARILAAAWKQDADWGTLIWLKMVTGARRGELCALRWYDVHLGDGVIEIRRNFTRRNGRSREKGTKTHQMRRLGLDPETIEVLTEQRQRYIDRMAELDTEAGGAAHVFSYDADHSRPCDPDGITHRYARMCRSLGIDSHLHTLRHYAATELINAGFDVRTVAGRLGHGGGGTTTLRVYAAWVPESDRRASAALAGKMRRPPAKVDRGQERAAGTSHAD